MRGVRMLPRCSLSSMGLGNLILMALYDVGCLRDRGGGAVQAYQVIPNDFKVSNAFGPFAPGNYVKIVHRNPNDAVASGVPESMGLAWGAVTSRKDEQGREIKKAIVRSACTQGELTKYGFDAHDGLGYFKQTFTDTSEEKGKIKAQLSVEGMSIDRTEHGGEFAAVIEVSNQHASKSLRLWFYDQRHRTMLGSGKKRMAGSVGKGELSISPLSDGADFNASAPFCLNAGDIRVPDWDIGTLVTKAMTSKKVKKLAIAEGDQETASEQGTFFATCIHDISIKAGSSVSFLLRSNSQSGAEGLEQLRAAMVARHEQVSSAAKDAFPALWGGELLSTVANKHLLATALPNILGSIGSFHGRVPIEPSPSMRNKEDHLTCIVPSRSFFPRGFLWDEGFHVLALLQPPMPQLRLWALEIIGSWLALQDEATGWIPREVPLGEEALLRVPEQFRAQSQSVSNPPALMLAVATLWNTPGAEGEEIRAHIRSAWLPALKRWFAYLVKVQAATPASTGWFWSEAPTCFRWKGRTPAHCLASGLDDYPRGLLVNEDECHLDLHAWMMVFARILAAASGEQQYKDTYASLHAAMFDKFKAPDAPHLLADYISKQPFNKTSGATLVVPPWSSNGQCSPRIDCDPYSSNPCCSPSGWCGNSPDHCKCEGCRRSKPLQDRKEWATRIKDGVHSPHIGYVSLFPMLLGVLDPIDDRPYLATMVQLTKKLLTPYGLASLDPEDPLFRSGEDYWRGKLWGNINALAVGSLANYAVMLAKVDAPLSAEMSSLAQKIRAGWLRTVHRGVEEHNFFYENFEPAQGEPRGAAPFTGWTAASVVLLSTGHEIEEATTWWRRAVMMGGEKGAEAEL